MKNNLIEDKIKTIDNYYKKINKLIINSRNQLKKNINQEMLGLYYEIGRAINELIEKYHYEASKNTIIKAFSKKLTNQFGQGFGVANLKIMKKFYNTYKYTGYTLCNQLNWSHNRLIMNIKDEKKEIFI